MAEEAREHHATTIFFETLVSPKVAETIAKEVGADTAVLDPDRRATAGQYGRLPFRHAFQPGRAPARARMFMSGVVEIAHGVVAYDGRPVLRDVSLRVEAGEVVAILGANGSGKSTLVRALLGLVPLTAGRVTLFGTPLAKFRQWRRIGYVPQRVGAGSGVPATVGEVVASGRLAGRGVLRPAGAADRAAVTAALEAVGLADRVHDPVSTLSGGQQQRTLIARALAGRPELLVLDEPTAGVDAASQDAFADALRGFVAAGRHRGAGRARARAAGAAGHPRGRRARRADRPRRRRAGAGRPPRRARPRPRAPARLAATCTPGCGSGDIFSSTTSWCGR